MTLSKRNKRGLFWLLLICFLIAITPRVLSFVSRVESPEISFKQMRKIHIEIVEKKNSLKQSKKNYSKVRYNKPERRFDPKDYQLKDWMKLGLSEKQSVVALKFSERGIADEEALKRIFVIPKELIKLIKDSIIYSQKYVTDSKSELKENKKIEIVDINTCTKEELKKISGIGDFFSTKIIEYRNQLGGFYSTSQLLEVWKFDNEKLDKISPYISLSNKLKKLNINLASIDELKSHPYISYAIANSIVKMRLHKNFESIEDIKRSKLIDDKSFDKIKPYLECK